MSVQQDIVRKIQKVVWVLLLFSSAINLLVLTIPLYLLQLYGRVIITKSIETLIYLTLIALFALVIMAILDVIRLRFLSILSTWVSSKIGLNALQATLANSQGQNRESLQVLHDVETVRRFMSGQAIIAPLDAPWMIIFILVIFMIHPLLGVIAVLGACSLFLIAVFNQRSVNQIISHTNTMTTEIQRYIDATARQSEAIIAMGMSAAIITWWKGKQQLLHQLQADAANRNALYSGLSKFLRLGLQIIILSVGAVLVLNNSINAGAMIVTSILFSRALAPVETTISQWPQIQSSYDAWKRIHKFSHTSQRKTSSVRLPHPQGSIEFDEVSFGLPKQKEPIINKLSYKILPGEIILLTGPSGIGKSTLLKLLLGVYQPQKGCIRLDGHDVCQWDRAEFGRLVGYVPQNIQLFKGSVRDNIARFQVGHDEDVIKAAQRASVHQMILRLPEGYNTEIGEDGVQLSGGQRQRIALARALYQEPVLLAFDEPNSNLDVEGEKALYSALVKLKKRGATVIIVSHKQSFGKLVDKVLLVQGGQLIGREERSHG